MDLVSLGPIIILTRRLQRYEQICKSTIILKREAGANMKV
jgi:hypothetical protein